VKSLVCASILFLSFCAAAETGPAFSYDVGVTDSGYQLRLEMSFSSDVTLEQVTHAFKSGFILSQVNPQVLSVENKPTGPGRYRQVMPIKTFGFRSELQADCEEISELERSWTRTCRLDTGIGGGRYMVWKTDTLRCSKDQGRVHCLAEIQGLAKPMQVLGIELISAKAFMVRAKYRAILNFAMTWFFLENGSLSISDSNRRFVEGPMQSALEKFQEEGVAAVKKSDFQFKDRFTLPPGESAKSGAVTPN
jgi:hypothetical protein